MTAIEFRHKQSKFGLTNKKMAELVCICSTVLVDKMRSGEKKISPRTVKLIEAYERGMR